MRRLRRTWTKPKCWRIKICGWTGLCYVARTDFVGDIPLEKSFRARAFEEALSVAMRMNREREYAETSKGKTK